MCCCLSLLDSFLLFWSSVSPPPWLAECNNIMVTLSLHEAPPHRVNEEMSSSNYKCMCSFYTFEWQMFNIEMAEFQLTSVLAQYN